MEPDDDVLNYLESDGPSTPFAPGDKVRFKSSVGYKLKLMVTTIYEDMDGEFTVTGLWLGADGVFREYHVSATMLEIDE